MTQKEIKKLVKAYDIKALLKKFLCVSFKNNGFVELFGKKEDLINLTKNWMYKEYKDQVYYIYFIDCIKIYFTIKKEII